MGRCSPFADLDAHQEMMEEISKAVDATMGVVDKAAGVLGDIERHNVNPEAHADIRKDIRSVTQTAVADVENRITNHNASATAHPALISKVTTMIATEVAKEAQNNKQLFNEISDIRTQSETLLTGIKQLRTEILSGSTGSSFNQKTTDMLLLRQAIDEMSRLHGIVSYDPRGPKLDNFVATLPLYMGKDSTVQFSMYGATPYYGTADTIRYAVEPITQGITLTPNANLRDLQTVNLQSDGTVEPGSFVLLKVTVKDTANGVSVNTIVGTVVAAPVADTADILPDLPSIVEPGTTSSTTITDYIGTADDDEVTIKIDPGTSGIKFEKTEGLAKGEEIIYEVPAGTEEGKELEFYIAVTDKYGNVTLIKKTIVAGSAATSGFKHDVPAIVVPQKKYRVSFKGLYDKDNNPAVYTISADDDEITFSKTADIASGEVITLTVGRDIIRGQEVTLTLTANFLSGASPVVVPVKTSVNRLPLTTDITTTLPAETYGNCTITFAISGGSDHEGDALTYNITTDYAALSFSKVKNIAPGEEVFLSLEDVTTEHQMSFKVFAVDKFGEQSANGKGVPLKLVPRPADPIPKEDPNLVPDRPTFLVPGPNAKLPSSDIMFKWTAFGTHDRHEDEGDFELRVTMETPAILHPHQHDTVMFPVELKWSDFGTYTRIVPRGEDDGENMLNVQPRILSKIEFVAIDDSRGWTLTWI